jgi:thiol-disulfide isomerase/thioredoxin
MNSVFAAVGIAFLGIIALAVGMQVLIRFRVRALRGKPAPKVPGALGQQISRGREVLLYFHSPGCAACRMWTPRFEQMSRNNSGVHVVDVSRSLDLARTFGIMATPSSVEIANGNIVDYHVGAPPADLLERFARNTSFERGTSSHA